MKTAIKTNAIITSISSKKDGSLGLRIVTPELTSDEKIAFLELQGINIDLFIKAIDFETKDIKEVKNEVDSKTPSQRLRSTLFVLWDSEGRPDEFSTYYSHKMEKIIDWLKGKIQ